MFSAKQIAKIQKKVAPKVDTILKKKEVEFQTLVMEKEIEDKRKKKEHFDLNILPHLKEIRNTIYKLEKLDNDNVPCLCIWKSKVYRNVDKRAIIDHELSDIDIEVSTNFRHIKSIDDKSYYTISEEMKKEEFEIHNWFSDHYAEIKIAMCDIDKNETDKSVLSNYMIIGSLSHSFLEKFSSKTPIHFIRYYRLFDELFKSAVSSEELEKIAKKEMESGDIEENVFPN